MKKQISIQQNALAFLHRILSETGVVSRQDARKQNTAFKCIVPAVEAYNKELDGIRKAIRKEKLTKDANGNELKSYYIDDADKEEFTKQMSESENKIVDVEFDIESLNVLNVAFDELFTKQKDLKEKGEGNGLVGEVTMSVVDQIETAFEGAKDIQ